MIDLKKEQESSLARPHYKYSLIAKLFFFTMDMLTGRKVTLGKVKLIEILASIPYRAWEIRQYEKQTHKYQDLKLVEKSLDIMEWGREAQDNEYWHLLIINEKMKEDQQKDPWYLMPLIPYFMIGSYSLLSRLLAIFNINRAFLLNAEFEDHAEHVYAQFVKDHPEWDTQSVQSQLVKKYGDFQNWGDVFRRVGLDERDHMNNSLVYGGKPDEVVKYEGMPELPTPI